MTTEVIMLTPSQAVQLAIESLTNQFGENRELVSIEPLGTDRLLVNTVFGTLMFIVNTSPDGRIILTEVDAPLTLQ